MRLAGRRGARAVQVVSLDHRGDQRRARSLSGPSGSLAVRRPPTVRVDGDWAGRGWRPPAPTPVASGEPLLLPDATATGKLLPLPDAAAAAAAAAAAECVCW